MAAMKPVRLSERIVFIYQDLRFLIGSFENHTLATVQFLCSQDLSAGRDEDWWWAQPGSAVWPRPASPSGGNGAGSTVASARHSSPEDSVPGRVLESATPHR